MPPKKPVPAPTSKPAARAPVKPAAGRGAALKGPAPAPAKKAPAAKPGQAAKKGPAQNAKGVKAASAAAGTSKPAQKKWTKEDDSARIIQTAARGYLARKVLARLRKEKQDYDDLIDRLEKEAYVQVARMQQEEVERAHQKEEEERRRRREDMKRRKRMLEAAFDGDEDEIKAVLKEVEKCDDEAGIGHDSIGLVKRKKHLQDMIDCEDPNGNTPLSEASGGGSVSTIKMLIEMGANPNSQGQFKRTPLYRAAFAGHLEACQTLLSNGGDPRIWADDGTIPDQVASIEPVSELLKSWDLEQTDILLDKLRELKQKRNEEEALRRQAEVNEMEKNIKEVEYQYQIKQKQLAKANEEHEKRISEYDDAKMQGFDKMELCEQAIHDAERALESARKDAENVQMQLQSLRLEMREANKGDEELPGVKAHIRELEEVLLRDVGNKIADSGKWPLLIDSTQKASTFLRYRDTNYLNALNPQTMTPDRIRMALIGALRFGKPVVLDMMGVDVFEACCMRFDEVEEGLMKKIMDRSIMKEENYKSLLQEDDGDDYQLKRFNEQRTCQFKFILITQVPYPPDDMLEKCYPISVICS